MSEIDCEGFVDGIDYSASSELRLRRPVHIVPGERFRVDDDGHEITISFVPGVTRWRDLDGALGLLRIRMVGEGVEEEASDEQFDLPDL